MNKLQRYQTITLRLCTSYTSQRGPILTQSYSTEEVSNKPATQSIQSSISIPIKSNIPKRTTFASLLRYSNFIDLGDPVGKVVQGTIVQTVGNDLYIDFGWKFNCVCSKPKTHSDKYVRGATVKLKIKDLELSSKFLGTTKDLTILEADCILLGLISSPLDTK